MKTIDVREAKAHLTRLLERVQAGEQFLIAKAGTPMAHLGPAPRMRRKVRFGLLKGKIWVPDDFNVPLPDEVLDAFDGRAR